MNENDDPYKILGVSESANDGEIKKAYRKLALKYHPDKQKTDADKEEATVQFAKIANAYEILSDPEEREQYDLRKKYGGAPGTRYTTTKSSSPPDGFGDFGTTTGFDEDFGFPKTTTYTTTKGKSPKTKTSSTRRVYKTDGDGPSVTKFSNNNGNFTGTVRNADGTTFTFSGSGFSDPFEVFKKAFEDKTGESLASDFGTKMNMSPKMTTMKSPTTKMSTTTSNSPTKTSKSTRMVNGVPVTTTTTTTTVNGVPKTTTTTSTGSPTKISSTPKMTKMSSTNSPKMKTMMSNDPQMKKMMSSPKMMSTGTGNNNKPMSMKTSTRTVRRPDGRKEVITETITTMADGTVQKSSSTKIM